MNENKDNEKSARERMQEIYDNEDRLNRNIQSSRGIEEGYDWHSCVYTYMYIYMYICKYVYI
jgi:hypothetical protein